MAKEKNTSAEELVKQAKDTLAKSRDKLDTIAIMKKGDTYDIANTQSPGFHQKAKRGYATVAYVSDFGKKVKTDTPHKHLREEKKKSDKEVSVKKGTVVDLRPTLKDGPLEDEYETKTNTPSKPVGFKSFLNKGTRDE